MKAVIYEMGVGGVSAAIGGVGGAVTKLATQKEIINGTLKTAGKEALGGFAPASPDIEEVVKDCPQSISVTDFPSTNIWKQTSSTNPPNASFPAVFSVPLIISF